VLYTAAIKLLANNYSYFSLFVIYPFNAKNFLTDFHHIFVWWRAISVAINAHIHKAIVHFV